VICGHIHEPRLESRADGIVYANCGDWIERASALVEHADGRLEIVDVEALLRDAGWEPEHADELEPVVAEDGEPAHAT
jgi:hypothetical protein